MPLSLSKCAESALLNQPIGSHLILLQRSLGAKSCQLLGHSRKTALLARHLVEHTGNESIWEVTPDHAFISGLAHDIGTLYVSDVILQKKEPLTSSDWDTIKLHPIHSAAHLADTPFSSHAPAALYHHERPDGRGYPFGKKGAELSPEARLIAFADQLVALAEDRPYRARLACEVVYKEVDGLANVYFEGALRDHIAEEAKSYTKQFLV